MRLRGVRIASCSVAALVTTLSAQTPPRTQFRVERPIVSTAGPHRLRVDVPLLVGSRALIPGADLQSRSGQPSFRRAAGLNDLRLYNAAGVEVPHLLVFPPAPATVWMTGRIAAIPTTEKTSGFEVDLGSLVTIDRIRLTGIPAPFMKLANLEGSGDRSHWTVLIDQTTVFDLPDNGLQQLELAFPPGPYRYVRVTWNDTNSARAPLPRVVDGRTLARDEEPAPPLTAPLAVERRPSEPGRSRYRLRLPGARLPIVALDLDVEGDYVLRRATVTESRLTSGEVIPFLIGNLVLRRDTRSDISRAPLRVPIAAPVEPDVELAIDDGDNPPLNLKGVTAVFAELPWIYFEGDGGPVVARYGDPALPAPQYDLEAARASIHIETVPDASWGDARALTPSDPAAVTAAMPIGGAPIDMATFSYTRVIPSGDAGLIAVPLDAATLAHSAGPGGRFADVRVTDTNKRQVPYLLERRAEPIVLEMSIEQRDAPGVRVNAKAPGLTSYYRVRLPFSKLPSPRLVLATTQRVFDRNVGIAIERPADERHRDAWIEPIASARWTHADRDTPTPALTLQLPTTDATELLLTIAEGDNTAIPIASAQLLLPSYRIRLFRDNGAVLRIAYGSKDIAPPNYDLALLAPQVLGVAAREVSLAPEDAGPAAQMSQAVTVLLSARLFWAVLIIAVVVLLALLARLLKREPPAGSTA